MNVRLKLGSNEPKACDQKDQKVEMDKVEDTQSTNSDKEIGHVVPCGNGTEQSKEESTSVKSDKEHNNETEAEVKSVSNENKSRDCDTGKESDGEHNENVPTAGLSSEILNAVNPSDLEKAEHSEKASDKNPENKNTQEDKESKSSDKVNNSDSNVNCDSRINSKLDAEALSASLSSSRCLLKRNRDDLDSDNDSDSDEDEPDSKKTNTGEVTPKSVSKLKSTELIASLSSSKSLLKRGIEKVEQASQDETVDAPESKKSNLSQPHEGVTSKNVESAVKSNEKDSDKCSRDEESIVASVVEEKIVHNKSPTPSTLVPKTLEFSISTASPVVINDSSSKSEQKKFHSTEKPLPPAEETKQRIGAKELAGQRQLERKRLNKMLSIFDDQKLVK